MHPRPRALRYLPYMLIRSIDLAGRYPIGREHGQPASSCLTLTLPETRTQGDPVIATPSQPAQARRRVELAGLKPPERSCCRSQLEVCKRFNEDPAPRHAPAVSRPTSKPVAPDERHHYSAR